MIADFFIRRGLRNTFKMAPRATAATGAGDGRKQQHAATRTRRIVNGTHAGSVPHARVRCGLDVLHQLACDFLGLCVASLWLPGTKPRRMGWKQGWGAHNKPPATGLPGARDRAACASSCAPQCCCASCAAHGCLFCCSRRSRRRCGYATCAAAALLQLCCCKDYQGDYYVSQVLFMLAGDYPHPILRAAGSYAACSRRGTWLVLLLHQQSRSQGEGIEKCGRHFLLFSGNPQWWGERIDGMREAFQMAKTC